MEANADPIARQMTWTEQFVSKIKHRFTLLRRKLPYIVWYDDELDVTVTLSQDKLDPENPLCSFQGGAFAEMQRTFYALGITFDSGQGPSGRDWEWDWSLKGPINVRFRGRAMRPHLRLERPRPRLVVSN